MAQDIMIKLIGSLTSLILALQGIAAAPNVAAINQSGEVLGDSTGLQFSLNDYGPKTLTYNGQNFLQMAASRNSLIIGNAAFRTPDGTEKPYGWAANTLDHDAYYMSRAIISTSTNPAFIQHIYRQGKEDSVTVKATWTSPDANTLKIDFAVTNNDPTDTLARITLGYFLRLQLPGAASQYMNNIPVVLSPLVNNGGYPVAFLGGSWGSMAYWMGDYSGKMDIQTNYGNAAQVNFDPNLYNFSTNPRGVKYEDPIAPGATKTYTMYLRFGASSDTAATLAPEAFALMRQTFPYLVNWPDRRPIARWFIAEGTKRSALNPRGYLWDPNLNAASSTVFRAKVLAQADGIVNRLNNMNPSPQGITIWDLEGQEFNHAFTYIGFPNKLPDIAPEMDAIADELFAKFTKAGYLVGMTLRPSAFGTGTTLPATCHSDTVYELADKFIKLDAQFPNRSFLCTAPNTWTQNANGKGLGMQVVLNDDTEVLNNLRSKVSYAKNRWGARIFYVDSTVYSGGNPLTVNIFRQLQKEFPDVIFFPENESLSYFGTSAPYNQANMGGYDTWSKAKQVYPQAFSMIEPHGVDPKDPAVYAKILASIKNGNIMYVDGWYSNSQDSYILQAYREAGITTSGVSLPATTTPPVIIPPATPTPISPDLNHDGVVNSLDYSILNRKWNLTSNISALDINQDGKINAADFAILKSKWHKRGD